MREVLLQQGRAEYGALLDLTETFHRGYAERYGLEYMRVDGPVLPDWAGFWDSIELFVMLLAQGVDRIFWLDADTLIVGDENIQDGLSDASLTMARHPGPPEHWNCGVFFIRNEPGVMDFFGEVLSLGPGQWPWYQQEIMNGLLAMPRWINLVGQMDNRWNSTVIHVEAPDPVIMAWHGTPGGFLFKYDKMRKCIDEFEYLRDRAIAC